MNKNRHCSSCGPWSLKDARNRTNVFEQHEGGGKKGRGRKKEENAEGTKGGRRKQEGNIYCIFSQ